MEYGYVTWKPAMSCTCRLLARQVSRLPMDSHVLKKLLIFFYILTTKLFIWADPNKSTFFIPTFQIIIAVKSLTSYTTSTKWEKQAVKIQNRGYYLHPHEVSAYLSWRNAFNHVHKDLFKVSSTCMFIKLLELQAKKLVTKYQDVISHSFKARFNLLQLQWCTSPRMSRHRFVQCTTQCPILKSCL